MDKKFKTDFWIFRSPKAYKGYKGLFGSTPGSGYVVFYHDDFDGLVSACLFNLRGVPALSIPPDRCIYTSTQFNSNFDIAELERIVREKLEVDDIWYIFLDFNMKNMMGLKDGIGRVFLTIDHHTDCPKEESMIVIHDPEARSCAELVTRTFPVPNGRENPEAIAKTLHAVSVIDSGGAGYPPGEIDRVLLDDPGCLVFYNINDKLHNNTALALLVNYMTEGINQKERGLLDNFKTLNAKLLKYSPSPILSKEINGQRLGVYYFNSTRMHRLFFSISAFRAFDSLEDFTILIRQQRGNYYRVSVRAKTDAYDVAGFCKQYGGGGKIARSGGFEIETENISGEIEKMVALFQNEFALSS